jgi:hypothetical protein
MALAEALVKTASPSRPVPTGVHSGEHWAWSAAVKKEAAEMHTHAEQIERAVIREGRLMNASFRLGGNTAVRCVGAGVEKGLWSEITVKTSIVKMQLDFQLKI